MEERYVRQVVEPICELSDEQTHGVDSSSKRDSSEQNSPGIRRDSKRLSSTSVEQLNQLFMVVNQSGQSK